MQTSIYLLLHTARRPFETLTHYFLPCQKLWLNVCYIACWGHFQMQFWNLISSVWAKLKEPEFRGWTSNMYVVNKLLFKGIAVWVVRHKIKASIMLQCQKRRYESFFLLFWTILCWVIILQRLHNRYYIHWFRKIIQLFTVLNKLLMSFLLFFGLELDLLLRSIALVNKRKIPVTYLPIAYFSTDI